MDRVIKNREDSDDLSFQNLNSKDIRLFRSVFRGREDVVAEYGKSTKGGGYFPICKNKGNNDLCKFGNGFFRGCRACKNKEKLPLSDSLINGHFSGDKILGIYPLLKDNNCHFVAADFDRHKPTDSEPIKDVKKFVEVCNVQEIPCYVLRSKSGNGYHVYIFFSDAVPAWKARTTVFALLREASVIGGDDRSSSFDRLFPNQDSLNGKGFGNLISLPFQGVAAQKGHTLFLNPETGFAEPYADQQAILKNIEMVTENQLDALIVSWNLIKERPQEPTGRFFKPAKEEKYLAVFSHIKFGCPFINHCCEDAETLPEPEWYAFLTIVARCRDGRRLAHQFSANYIKYSREETDDKIDHALTDTGPYKCQTIEAIINSNFCMHCQSKGKIQSPLLLGYKLDDSYRYEEVIDALNSKHAVIMVGGKCHILNEIIDPITDRPDITLSTVADFRNFYANQLIPDPDRPNKKIGISEFWFKHKNRRQYTGIVFDPSGNAPPRSI